MTLHQQRGLQQCLVLRSLCLHAPLDQLYVLVNNITEELLILCHVVTDTPCAWVTTKDEALVRGYFWMPMIHSLTLPRAG